MEVAEALILIFFDYILKIPGAAIRWFYHLGRKPFKAILKEEPGLNTAAGFGLMILVICAIIIFYY